MPGTRLGKQPDLFDPQRDSFSGLAADGAYTPYAADLEEPPDEAFVQRIRDEITGLVERCRGAERLPFRDLAQAFLTELRVASVSNWLPESEALSLRAAFTAEMQRLYAAEDAAADR
jgi:hypothetical protein